MWQWEHVDPHVHTRSEHTDCFKLWDSFKRLNFRGWLSISNHILCKFFKYFKNSHLLDWLFDLGFYFWVWSSSCQSRGSRSRRFFPPRTFPAGGYHLFLQLSSFFIILFIALKGWSYLHSQVDSIWSEREFRFFFKSRKCQCKSWIFFTMARKFWNSKNRTRS